MAGGEGQTRKSLQSHFDLLIFLSLSVNLRAMFRYVIIFVSIAWASLLLLSWSGPTETAAQPTAVTKNAS